MARKKSAPRKKVAKKAPARKSASARPKAAAPAPTPAALSEAFKAVYTPPPQHKVETVTLDPDIAPHFRSSRAVNEALRALLRIVRQVRE